MTLPPTIPTSFVPHSNAAPRRFSSDFTGAFGFFAYAVLGIIFLMALGVFSYGRILSADKLSKDKELLAAEAAIDSKTVENFVRLNNRIAASEILLGEHVAFSGFFSSLEKIMPTTVRFTTLNLSFDTKGMPNLKGTGVAKNFNALAAASAAFATDGRIKDAIFSDINVNKDNSVSFSLGAILDRSIITFSP
ncbi:MAG: hypothetical protein Q8L30_02055 [bacterium]|nr:hypothetical protein [bacterium]